MPRNVPLHRRIVTARVYRRGEEPGDDLSATTTVAERLAMVDVLSARAFELSGRDAPSYSRRTMPVRVYRRQ